MAEAKTRPNDASVDAFLDRVENQKRREDAKAICALMARVSGKPAVMWGDAIVGFGRRAYALAGGKTGEMLGIGFSPRSADLTLYMPHRFEDDGLALVEGLEGVKKKGSCLHVKDLAKVDAHGLETLTRRSWDAVVKDNPQ